MPGPGDLFAWRRGPGVDAGGGGGCGRVGAGRRFSVRRAGDPPPGLRPLPSAAIELQNSPSRPPAAPLLGECWNAFGAAVPGPGGRGGAVGGAYAFSDVLEAWAGRCRSPVPGPPGEGLLCSGRGARGRAGRASLSPAPAGRAVPGWKWSGEAERWSEFGGVAGGGPGASCCGVVFLLVGGEAAWGGEDDSKAQPDVAGPAPGLATIRGGPAGRAAGGPGPAGPGEGSLPGRSERAAAGRAGPETQVRGGGSGTGCSLGAAGSRACRMGGGLGSSGVGGALGLGRPPGSRSGGSGIGWGAPTLWRRGEARASEVTKAPQQWEARLQDYFTWDQSSLFL